MNRGERSLHITLITTTTTAAAAAQLSHHTLKSPYTLQLGLDIIYISLVVLISRPPLIRKYCFKIRGTILICSTDTSLIARN